MNSCTKIITYALRASRPGQPGTNGCTLGLSLNMQLQRPKDSMSNILAPLIPRLAADARPCLVDSGLVTFINLYSYSRLRPYAKLLASFDKIGVDGISMCWLARSISPEKIERVSFDMTSLAPIVFRNLSNQGKSIYLIGSRNSEISAAKERLAKAFPQLQIAGFRSGHFESEQARQASIEDIVSIAPDVVLAGMGAPVQEQYLVDLWQAGWRGAGYTCGGFFHQSAQKLDYYPTWADRMNLRWAYRMWDEPRLVRRYSMDYPKAATSFLADAIALKINR